MIRLRLKEIAESKKLTQAKIVELTGLPPNTIRSYYYNQIQRPDLRVLNLICKKLGISLFELLEETDDILALAGQLA
jgi:transcriptional regulator with XRE-family HTH domain